MAIENTSVGILPIGSQFITPEVDDLRKVSSSSNVHDTIFIQGNMYRNYKDFTDKTEDETEPCYKQVLQYKINYK